MGTPPKIAKKFLQIMVDRVRHYSYFGDLEEMYCDIGAERGFFRARLWYWTQVVKNLPGYILYSIYWSIVMFKNYFKIAFRNIRKSKGFSFINIFGFSIGITACVLVYLVANFVLSWDKFHDNIDEIYMVQRENFYPNGSRVENITQLRLLSEILNTFPEVVRGTRNYSDFPLISYQDKNFSQVFNYVDTSFFDVFSFELIKGNSEEALKRKNTVVLTETMATKYFGEDDPIGKVITVNKSIDYVVNGVMKDIPQNSSIHFDMLAPFENAMDLPHIPGWDHFSSSFLNTFIIVNTREQALDLEPRLQSIMLKHLGEKHAESVRLRLINFGDFHASQSSDEKYAKVLLGLAVSILLIAIFNFVNLSTARFIHRAKEIGMRKVLGAKRMQLIKQFLVESVFISGAAMVIGIALVQLSLPTFVEYTDFEVRLALTEDPVSLMYVVLFGLSVGVTAGLFPSLLFSKNRPVESLKGKYNAGKLGGQLRSGLVLVQFTFSAILIVGSLVIWKQLNFMKSYDMGFDKENVVAARTTLAQFDGAFGPGGQNSTRVETFREELLRHESIQFVSFSMNVPGVNNRTSRTNALPSGWDRDRSLTVNLLSIDDMYIDTYKMGMVAGRNFSRENPLDRAGKTIIINQTLFNLSGSEILNSTMRVGGTDYEVIGVMKDYNFRSLHREISPLVFFYGMTRQVEPNHVSVRFKEENLASVLAIFEEKWSAFDPQNDFNYFFVDERFNRLYQTEEKIGTLTTAFSFFAILLASLGLYGLFSFTVVQRTKEIGVRKVLGASIAEILATLSKKFSYVVVISNVIAWPIAYSLMNTWLESFAYRTSLGISLFFYSGLSVLLIAILTIIYQALRAALRNPVYSLRQE